jgi:single-stranded-DNA-specific exonuclease
MLKRWVIPSPIQSAAIEGLEDLPELAQQVLAGRGLTSPEGVREYLDRADPGHDPFLLRGMDLAVERILSAADRADRVAIYGDYDADGITATAILWHGLRSLGLAPIAYLPDRFVGGYGVRIEALDALRSQGVALVITVDCGVRSVAEIAWAQANGLEVIVTDHHLPGPTLPPALVVVNPQLSPVTYPYLGLSGAGVAYKLVQALGARRPGKIEPSELQDLVAIGTIADLAPLDGENRHLVARGLEQVRRQPRAGLQALLRVAGVQPASVTASTVAFGLAPRLNAAGRMDSPRPALDLLLADEAAAAESLAHTLERANRERQSVTRKEFERARDTVLALPDLPPLLSVHGRDLGEGILGLVAARLTEEFYRPAMVARVGDETARASLRSIGEFPITAALERIGDQLLEFGGHATAAGFTALSDRLPSIVRALGEMAAEALAGEPTAELRAEAIAHLGQLDERMLAFLDQLEPTGQANPAVLFAALGLDVLSKRAVGSDGAHLKLLLRDGGQAMEAIGFRLGSRLPELPGQVDALFHLERNRYLGVETLQLNLQDVRPASRSPGT